MKRIELEFPAERSALKILSYFSLKNLALSELGTKQNFVVPRVALLFRTYVMKNGKISDPSFLMFCERNLSGTLLNSPLLLQLVVRTFQSEAKMWNEVTAPTVFEAPLSY